MTDPDYNAHLQTIYPGTQWTISRFSHGSINATHRAVKTAGEAGPSSLVLKHASPYFVDDDTGRVQPFSIKRQEIEAAIMTLSAGIMQPADGSIPTWRLPHFLHRSEGKESELLRTEKDEVASVMLIEDLGNVRNLRDTILAFAEKPSLNVDKLVANIGCILGTTLATMHSAATARAIENSGVKEALSQQLADDVVWFLAMELLPDYLAGAPRAKEYFQWLVDDVQRPRHAYPPCLMHGDFNYGNILMPADALETGKSQPIVVDWEFATSQGRGVNGDISEFLSMIHCRIIGGRREQAAPRSARLFRQLCASFCSAYREEAQLVCTMKPDDLNTQLYRSALLLSGRDILTFANDACADYANFEELVQVGLWYFERAGACVEEFVKESNCVELEKEDEGFVRSLFIFV
ncbi:Aminoglycoside phosphotransferase [Akanthomyces lecanii RCEF 1005]|uniref:Aminoglycoside phosphotransferase n=1 Tax=Akanthomyces lecanii RCEF 1005 TaxID=1081108 RepID=A0A168KSB3_CORDF|nr:Aminoglycoside phosphotransferase [Akanthomyces lecanii RCEF 1005]